MKYTHYYTRNEVICVAPFDGRNVRTKAKCHPDDTFDQKAGEELADLRMDEKILGLRMRDLHQEIDGLRAMIGCLEARLTKRLAKAQDLHSELLLAKVRREAAEESL